MASCVSHAAAVAVIFVPDSTLDSVSLSELALSEIVGNYLAHLTLSWVDCWSERDARRCRLSAGARRERDQMRADQRGQLVSMAEAELAQQDPHRRARVHLVDSRVSPPARHTLASSRGDTVGR